jgi:hypothetical protein
MDQSPTAQQQEPYGGVPLGVESAWLPLSGAPISDPGLSPSSSYPNREPGIGAAFSLRAARRWLAALMVAAGSPAGAATCVTSEYEFRDAAAEPVRGMPIRREPPEISAVFEHSVQPESGAVPRMASPVADMTPQRRRPQRQNSPTERKQP